MPAYSNSCRRCPVPWPKYAARHRRSRCRCSAGCACGISWPAQKCYRPKACGSRLHPWLFPPGLAVKPSYLIRIPHPHPGCKRDLPPNFHTKNPAPFQERDHFTILECCGDHLTVLPSSASVSMARSRIFSSVCSLRICSALQASSAAVFSSTPSCIKKWVSRR